MLQTRIRSQALALKQTVHKIKPAFEPTSEPDSQSLSLAHSSEIMDDICLPSLPGIEIIEEKRFHWIVEGWSTLPDRACGPTFKAGGYNWNLLLYPRGNKVTEHVAVYLEFPEAALDAKLHACAQFAISISNPSDPASSCDFQTLHHRFDSNNTDWGFAKFAAADHCLSQAHSPLPFIEHDRTKLTLILRVVKDPTGVLWHNFTDYDSKETTGYVGLKNQGATCYMNSLFQSLYCTNIFRKAVYMIPSDISEDTESVVLALQRLFYNLQSSEEAVSTIELTKSFGWGQSDAFMQHDIQEFNRILLDTLENKMKGTAVDGAIKDIFLGKMKSYIKCINVDYESSRCEDYYDIQLNIKGFRTLEESFQNYIAEEILDGDNQYMSDTYGLQDAKKGIIFESFPPVLQLQLKRFEYDMEKDSMLKVNDRHEFPLEINLETYLAPEARKTEPYNYNLHGVLVHVGDLTAGHYYAFVKPQREGPWFKFDDDLVTPCTLREVLEENYGGDYLGEGYRTYMRRSSAYMLVYIRKSNLATVLADVSPNDIPTHLVEKFERERQAAEQRKKEREQQAKLMDVMLVTEDAFRQNERFGFIDGDNRRIIGDKKESSAAIRIFQILRQTTLTEFMEELGRDMKLIHQRLRLWSLTGKHNGIRVDQPISDTEDGDSTIEDVATKYHRTSHRFSAYVEITGHHNLSEEQPREELLLVFLKFFDIEHQHLVPISQIFVAKTETIMNSYGLLRRAARRPHHEDIDVFVEISYERAERLKPSATYVEECIRHGDIICVQRHVPSGETRLWYSRHFRTNVACFLREIASTVIINFYHESGQYPPISFYPRRDLLFRDVRERLAARLKVNPPVLLIYTIADSGSIFVVRSHMKTVENTLANLHRSHVSDYTKFWYRILDKRDMEICVTLCTPALDKQHDLPVRVPHIGNFTSLFRQVMTQIIDLNKDKCVSRDIRVFQAINNQFHRELQPYDSLASIEFRSDSTIYAEEIPEEELEKGEMDFFIRVFHFQHHFQKTHSVPFRFLVKRNEKLEDTKHRLQMRTGLSNIEWKNTKLVLVTRQGSLVPITDGMRVDQLEWDEGDQLGLDHIGRASQLVHIKMDRSLSIRG
ncbi:hypothetical protein BCR43DRAFT_158924 [Syncephalastrum racemosum]|uniref:ubiquitinyl hydrolase 1 n=1 Tax=Syncephalastrum racemosum TaxID=13706 RepID=A0A1X2HNL4_SYNRA|nr:hypothetical protein BCR43DRAFT_158924 [Syncephalastrum racemosum]